ncbi:MAG: OmpA family protein [Xanthobacteraceae bacterium]|nr:MAG: OmpA family protein [Xanthobacteraceae bacterium]
MRKWWPGLVPLAVIWVAAAWTQGGAVERDLRERTAATLKEAVLDKTRIEVAGRDLTLAAEAFSEEGRRSAVAMAGLVPGVRLVTDRTRLVPRAEPFTWSAQREVARLILRGSVPLPATRSRLAEAARGVAGGVEIADEMAFGRGAPPRFDAAAVLLIEQLGRLKEGQVQLAGTQVSLAGMARELGGREAIAAALGGLPEGFTVAENAVRAPPYIFQANKDPVAATLTLSGVVPDNASHAALIAAARRKFFNEKIVDNLKASIGAPANFAAAAAAALGELSRLSTGSLVMSDRTVKLSGDALYPVAAEQIRGGLGPQLPQGWQAGADISVKPPAGNVDPAICQQLFGELLGKGRILFESGRAAIERDSVGLLDNLVEVALRCPQATLVIAGHTDADGDDQANMALSERRAKAVADYLAKAGIAADHLKPVGYGRSRPVASNDSEDGKALNRRIEFTVE